MNAAEETTTAGRAEAVPAPDLVFWAGTLFTAAVLLHNVDHVRRGADAVSAEVFLAGTAAILLEVAVVVLCVQRHPLVPAAALWSGVALAVGYLVVHFTPRRAWLSDSLLSGADRLSVVAATVEVLAALTLALAGAAVLRRGSAGRAALSQAALPATRALAHPVALVMVVGNATVIAVSVAQRA